MRFAISLSIGLACASFAFAAADKKLPIEESSNELVAIQATVIIDKEQIRQELGSDFGGGVVLVRMRVRPLTDKAWKIDRDDFLLMDGNLGLRATPYAPSQLAGNSTLVVSSVGTRGGVGGQGNGPVFGIPGIGMPRQMPGNGGGVGVIGGQDQAKATIQDGDKKGESPLLKTLKEKVLPENEITEPVSGLLYFALDGKVKVKDLELYYKTPGGKLGLRFRP